MLFMYVNNSNKINLVVSFLFIIFVPYQLKTTTMTILKQLQTKLPQFTWTQENKHSSIFGCITVPQVTKRIDKDLHKLNNIYVFISSKMGGTELSGAPFRYAICYQKAEVREYRRKNTYVKEYNKLFVSGKNAQAIVNELVKKIDMNQYYLK